MGQRINNHIIMATLTRYRSFKQLKREDKTQVAIGTNTTSQKTDLESFFKLLSKEEQDISIINFDDLLIDKTTISRP